MFITADQDMDKSKSQVDEHSHRKSMLPQKTNIKSFPRPLGVFPKQDSHEAGEQAVALAEAQVSTVPQAAQNKAASMLPPSKLRSNATIRPSASLSQKTSKSECAKVGHIPKESSTSQKRSIVRGTNAAYPSQDSTAVSQPRHSTRINSGGSQSNARETHHGRSLSQQVRPTATSDFLPSKASLQRHSSMKNPRPVFSTMQQHSSPKKSFQADPCTLPSSDSTQSTSKDAILSADVFHLQMELAQLQLLHRSVLPVLVQWEKSAKRSFEQRFKALYERHIELQEVAHQQQTLINQFSLVQWSQDRSGAHISEKVQLLSHHVSDICNLVDSEGKYTHVFEIFESWFVQALRVRAQRDSNSKKISRDLDFIEGIGDGWKAEAMVLERELTYSARDLENFGDVSSSSSLRRILSMYRRLLDGLLEELDLIQWIENEIMTQETSWIESTIYSLASEVNEDIGRMGEDREAV